MYILQYYTLIINDISNQIINFLNIVIVTDSLQVPTYYELFNNSVCTYKDKNTNTMKFQDVKKKRFK